MVVNGMFLLFGLCFVFVEMCVWGWCIFFLVSVVFVVFGLWICLKIIEILVFCVVLVEVWLLCVLLVMVMVWYFGVILVGSVGVICMFVLFYFVIVFVLV